MQRIIDYLATEEATTMSVEKWFDTYGVAILKREQQNQQRTGLKAMNAAAGR